MMTVESKPVYHKNCKLFISHGGFLSLAEAINYGVPMVGTPVLADQLKNVEHMKRNGYGVQIKLENVTEQSILWAINQVLENPKYAERIRKQSKLFLDKPETALETAVFWTEYVIRHNGAHHLKPAIASMPWYQQAMIDVYLTIALIVIIPLYIFFRILKCICTRSSNKSKIKKD